MARTGRPPLPIEVKRRRGTLRPGRLAPAAVVVALPAAGDPPPCPGGLGAAGRQLWERAWTEANAWLSPDADATAVEQAALLADDLALARARAAETGDRRDVRAVVALSRAFTSTLGLLGFSPIARTRLLL